MMKKLLFAGLVLIALTGCRVRHDHSQKMGGVRVFQDSVPHDTIAALEPEDVQTGDEEWMEEDMIHIPDAPEDAKGEAHPETQEEIERMLQGKE